MLNIYVEERVAQMQTAARDHELERRYQLYTASATQHAEKHTGKRRSSRAMIWLGERVQRWSKRRHADQAAHSSRWERRSRWPAARPVDQQPR